jgi:hypothetical protein
MKKQFKDITEEKPETKQKIKPVSNVNEEKENVSHDINDVMASFEANKSVFTEANPQAADNVVNTEISTNDETIFTPEFATRIVLRIGNAVLTRLNLMILNSFSKVKVDIEELELTEDELEELSVYAEPVAAELLRILPDWALGIIHVEFMYIEKFTRITKHKKQIIEAEKETEKEFIEKNKTKTK